MSYDIYISEAVIGVPDDPSEWNGLDVEVHGLERDDAPSFPGDEMTGKSNSRHPGYSQWADFLRDVGLYSLFLDRESGRALMQNHPGCTMLTRADHEQIAAALDRWRTKHPGKVPGWDPTLKGMAAVTGEGADPKYDGNLARLIWLEWWVRWALANCKTPAIYNS